MAGQPAATKLDACDLLESLRGRDLVTLTYGRWNRVLRLESSNVIVATARSPGGKPVPISDVQDALDLLASGEWLRLDTDLSHRSAFIGAALRTLEGVEFETEPRRLRRVK